MKREHGTIQNYVIGFVLSLIFTLIPYYLVVNHIITGTLLLGTIIGFALLQMMVQVLFFLHLGRERKPRWQAMFLQSTVGAIFVVTVGTTWIMYHLHINMTPSQQELKALEGEGLSHIGTKATGACEGAYVLHKVTIKNDLVIPNHISAHRCDRLVFTNEDNTMRDIAFGPHVHHVTYGGVESLMLHKGYPETLILNQTGTQTFHDHLHQETAGDFTVTP